MKKNYIAVAVVALGFTVNCGSLFAGSHETDRMNGGVPFAEMKVNKGIAEPVRMDLNYAPLKKAEINAVSRKLVLKGEVPQLKSSAKEDTNNHPKLWAAAAGIGGAIVGAISGAAVGSAIVGAGDAIVVGAAMVVGAGAGAVLVGVGAAVVAYRILNK